MRGSLRSAADRRERLVLPPVLWSADREAAVHAQYLAGHAARRG